jgi:hypothetical protein
MTGSDFAPMSVYVFHSFLRLLAGLQFFVNFSAACGSEADIDLLHDIFLPPVV